MSSADQYDEIVTLQDDAYPPSYDACIEWMRTLPESKATTLDVWARGNYTRRLLTLRRQNLRPLLVRVESVDEMRFSYRRLALLGLPVDLVYAGPVSAEALVKHWHPLDGMIDAAWGYIAFMGTIVEGVGHQWFPILGSARLMPEPIAEWLAGEAATPFKEGRLFIAPAEHIGLRPLAAAGEFLPLAEVAKGTSVVPSIGPTRAALDIDLPTLDGMSPDDFEKFLRDHAEALSSFRDAFSSITSNYHMSQSAQREAIEKLRHEVDSLTKAQRNERLRLFIRNCKGSLTTFPVALSGLAAASAAYSKDPFAATAALAAAGKTLRDLWLQARAAASEPTAPLQILWKLGVKRLKHIPRSRAHRLRKKDFATPSGAYHWLCPPTAGLRTAVQKKDDPPVEGNAT